MTKRIFRSILSVTLIGVFACLGLIVGVLHGYFEERLETELAAQTVYIAQGLENEGVSYFDGLDSDSRITWVSADGTVLYDNRSNEADMENHADRQEIQDALTLGHGQAVRYSETLAQKTIYYALRLSDGTVLRTSDTQYSVWMLVVQAMQPAALVVLAVLILAAYIASRVSKQIVEPINAIDLSHPDDEGEYYEEIVPLLAKIRSQNRKIQHQMAQLSCRQEEFAAITENMSEGFLVLDCKTTVLSYNAAALRLLFAEDCPMDGEVSAYQLNREAGFRRCVERALAGYRCEELLESHERCRQIIASPVFQEKHLTGAVLVILDITEKQQREGLRREFTANVSHELKTPLTSILGTSEIMSNGLVRPEDIPHFAQNIHAETSRLIQLVNDIIHLSRLDEGGPKSDWETVELYALADKVLEQLRPAAEKKHLTLTLTGEAECVRAVPQIAEEIVYNLCDNAVAYNREGGSVQVFVGRENGSQIVRVTDTGIGIPAEARERIFERFYRVDKSHSSGGTGLGLSIVKHGAAYLGASVQVKSEEGKGSTFTLIFPDPNEKA